jgi:hypothetical protein
LPKARGRTNPALDDPADDAASQVLRFFAKPASTTWIVESECNVSSSWVDSASLFATQEHT